MAESKQGSKGFDVLRMLREGRDAGIDKWAKIALRLTSSRPYHRVTSAVARPTLLATALFRNATGTAMSALLAQLNMPSREEVLTLSKRLTHIEMVLDDLGAGVDQIRRTNQAGAAAARPPRGSSREREASRESSSREPSNDTRAAATVAASEG